MMVTVFYDTEEEQKRLWFDTERHAEKNFTVILQTGESCVDLPMILASEQDIKNKLAPIKIKILTTQIDNYQISQSVDKYQSLRRYPIIQDREYDYNIILKNDCKSQSEVLKRNILYFLNEFNL